MHSRSTTAVALAFACLVSNAAAEATEDVSRFGWVVSAREVPTVATGMRRRWFLDGLDKDARAMRTSCAASGLDHVWLLESDDSSSAARAGRSLASDPDVEWIEPLQRRAPADLAAGPPAGFESIGFPNDPLFVDGRQWGLDNRGAAGVYGGVAGADIRAVQAWSMSRGDPSVRLAIADTGIDPHHPDLAMETPRGPRIELGINVTTDPSGSWADSAGHGTAVAGVMAARTGDGAALDSLGMAGVCGGDGGDNAGCRIVPIKITSGHATAATSFDVARAIVYAVTVGARAVNVSFAGTGTSRLERLALSYAIERGCLVVAASGNRGASAGTQPQYPAAYAADGLCLQVGASDVWDRRAVFSSYGPGLDVVAPGVDIWTTFPTYPSAAGATYPGYVSVSGTSFAAPFATGVAGLLAARRPELGADDLPQLVRATAHDVGAPGPDAETGAGRLDAAAALRAIGAGVGIWRDEVAADTWIDRGVDTLVVEESGPGSMRAGAWPRAHLIEARTTVAVPDSFLDSLWIWPRVTGTSTVRSGWRLHYFAPYAEVASRGERTFTLRGFLYRLAPSDGVSDSIDVPLPLDQARFGFTVIGPVRRPRAERPPDPSVSRCRALPNPFHDVLVIERPPDVSIDVYDASGRRVRAWPADGSVAAIRWNGRDLRGAQAPPGIYWLRGRGPRGVATTRVIKLE